MSNESHYALFGANFGYFSQREALTCVNCSFGNHNAENRVQRSAVHTTQSLVSIVGNITIEPASVTASYITTPFQAREDAERGEGRGEIAGGFITSRTFQLR